MTLSAVVIAKNEEANIGRCLKSIMWADEIIVVDSNSTDKTVEFAVQYGAKVFTSEWRGYGPAKRAGVARAGGQWILSLDADEQVTGLLAQEIRDIVTGPSDCAGYYINRRTNFLGRWIRHCGWYPDPVLRLFRKDSGDVNEAPVHEKVEVNGPVGKLEGEILHYSYPTLETYFEKFNRYTTMGAEEALRRGKKCRWFDLTVRPVVSFFTHFVSRQGFRDGTEGFLISVLSSAAVLVKYAKLRQLNKTDRKVTANIHAAKDRHPTR